MNDHFGEHLTIDGYGGDEHLLNNKEFILQFLKNLVGMLEMNVLIGPEIAQAPDNGIKDPGGWSAFLVIAESHISIHTFPKRRFVSADIYTCKNGLDVERLKEYFSGQFKLKDLEINFIIRGKKYPSQNF